MHLPMFGPAMRFASVANQKRSSSMHERARILQTPPTICIIMLLPRVVVSIHKIEVFSK
jgi:hypothetical protein